MSAEALRSEEELRELIVLGGRALHHQGLMDYLGHISARSPLEDRFLIKPKFSPDVRGLHSLTSDMLVAIDGEGALVEGSARPPAEVFIHTEIYRARPDVNAVVHTHQPAATLMGMTGARFKPLLHVPATFVHEDVPAWPCALLVTSQALGADLAGVLAGQSFCHLQNHGIVSVADTVEAAVVGAYMLEQLALANLAALHTGLEPREIPPDELATLREQVGPVGGRWAYLTQLASGS